MSAIDRKHKYAPGGPIAKSANTAGAKARIDERMHGLPASALVPSSWSDHQVIREAWLTGYLNEVKVGG
jgi:hypothetical protein